MQRSKPFTITINGETEVYHGMGPQELLEYEQFQHETGLKHRALREAWRKHKGKQDK